MKGYFSRIAKQSGLRFSESGGNARAVGKERASHVPAPPGIEETILVPPTDMARVGLGWPKPKPEGESQKTGVAKPKSRQKQTSMIMEVAPVLGTEKSDLEYLKEEGTDSSMPGEKIETPREDNVPAESKPAGKIRIIGRTVFADAGMPNVRIQDEPAKPEETKAKTVGAVPLEQADRKRHFVKTAEAIEQGERGTAEIQNIVFREVQEWVAASPPGTVMPDTDVETSGNMIKQKAVRVVPEPRVIAMAESPEIRNGKRMESAENAENPGLEEQIFSLSIGTISVIADADTPVRQAEPRRHDQGNPHNRQESARQFPRLRRNYL